MSSSLNQYEKILSVERYRKSSVGKRRIFEETGSDRARILFSHSFRRLQQKAQVFPLESNSAVRTRLTHSLEVAHTGRYLAQEILTGLREKYGDAAYFSTWLGKHEIVFTDVVESSCLMHDIGNPPFGHFGEKAIRDWFRNAESVQFAKYFKTTKLKNPAKKAFIKGPYTDFLAFDGNPQGFRLVSRLQGGDGISGLNLTYALLRAYQKYACLPSQSKMIDSASKVKKAGYFYSEEEIVAKSVKAVGISKSERHPLSYIMEAADDISYCMSDIEDGIEKGIVRTEDFFSEIVHLWDDVLKEKPKLAKSFLRSRVREAKKKESLGLEPFVAFKSDLINRAVQYSAKAYVNDHDQILSGKYGRLIDGEAEIIEALEVLRVFVIKNIFTAREAEDIELAGYSIIFGLLDQFSPLLELPTNDFYKIICGDSLKGLDLDREKRLVGKLADKAKRAYVAAVEPKELLAEWHLRAHLIVDYISGMTDMFALETYQLLSGIKIRQ